MGKGSDWSCLGHITIYGQIGVAGRPGCCGCRYSVELYGLDGRERMDFQEKEDKFL